MKRTRIERPDGRYVYFYSLGAEPQVSDVSAPVRKGEQIELRWNPLLDEQVIVSTARQERTFLPPPEYCPLCPTREGLHMATEIPAKDFEIAVFENRFPSFRPDAPEVSDDSPLERRARAAGVCEVVVYTPEHDATLASLDEGRLRLLVDVWADRYAELSARDDVTYVFVFENRGKEIGVTLTHPHGQIYAFPFVPPRAERERASSERFARDHGGCLMCEIVRAERARRSRIVTENDAFVAYVPFAARLPYEVHVAALAHRPSLLDLNKRERADLASMLRVVQATYDGLWRSPMPYTMSMHQRTSKGEAAVGDHLHVEFVPPCRSRDKLKYLAGVETGAGTFINDTAPEEKAAELRHAHAQWSAGG